jgi:hypothetical protein
VAKMKKFLIILIQWLILSVFVYAEMPNYENVTKLYVATFNRAPDAAGLSYWVNDSGMQLEQIAQSFFDQPETREKYPAGSSAHDFIRAVYNNLFNRDPDEDGWQYWEQEISSGNILKSVFILAVINGAQDTREDRLDKTILGNKSLVGLYFTLYRYNDTDFAKNIMEAITASASSVESAKDTLFDMDKKLTADTSCIIDFFYNDGYTFTACYPDIAVEVCSSIQESDFEASWYGFPVKGECLSLSYPQDSENLTNNGYTFYSQTGLYGDDDGYTNLNDLATITSEGGDIKISDIIFHIPQNAIGTDTVMQVGKLYTMDEDSASARYALTDILDKTVEPITVKIPAQKAIGNNEEVYLQYIPAKGGYSTSEGDSPYISMFDAHVENGYIIGDIYNFAQDYQLYNFKLWDKIKGALVPKESIKDIYSFLEAKAMHREKTDDGLFKIYYPVNYASFYDPTLETIDTLKEGLEKAAAKFESMGFIFDSLHAPIPVVLVKNTLMGNPKNKAEQTKPIKFVTNKYPMIKINIAELKRAKNDSKISDEMAVTVGHEFFHVIQNLYDPAWFNDGSSVFLAEASSVWSEYVLSKHPSAYSPDVADTNSNFQNYGLDDKSFGKYSVWTNGSISSLQNLGYGTAIFLRYATLAKQNDNLIYDIWSNYKQGDTAVQAMAKAMNLSTMWRRFAMDFNTGFVNFAYKDYTNWPNVQPLKILDISSQSSFTKSFMMPPYSANSIVIGNGSETEEYDINITIGEKGGSLYDSDAYLYDTKSAVQLKQFGFDGTPVTFHVGKKPSRKTLTLINSGSVKMDVDLDIKVDEQIVPGKWKNWPDPQWCPKESPNGKLYNFIDYAGNPSEMSTKRYVPKASGVVYDLYIKYNAGVACEYEESSLALKYEQPYGGSPEVLLDEQTGNPTNGILKYYENGKLTYSAEIKFGIQDGYEIRYDEGKKIECSIWDNNVKVGNCI